MKNTTGQHGLAPTMLKSSILDVASKTDGHEGGRINAWHVRGWGDVPGHKAKSRKG